MKNEKYYIIFSLMKYVLDILIATPNRLVYLLDQDPPAVELNK